MRRLVLVLMVVLLAAVWTAPAAAQQLCGTRTEIVTRLNKAFSELPSGMGVTSNGLVFEIFASPTGTWTALISYPNGWSCINSVGEGWENLGTFLSSTEIAGKVFEPRTMGLE